MNMQVHVLATEYGASIEGLSPGKVIFSFNLTLTVAFKFQLLCRTENFKCMALLNVVLNIQH